MFLVEITENTLLFCYKILLFYLLFLLHINSLVIQLFINVYVCKTALDFIITEVCKGCW